ncbi:MAG: prohibitin family protein [Anaerolineae bacterium]|jgi:regulator of protease activity HflC (stomatin/prohibitin superfamily)
MAKRSGLAGAVIIIGVVALSAFIVFMSSYTQIEYGTVGMVTRFGRITNQVMRPGLNWKTPFVDKVVVYHTQEMVYVTELDPSGYTPEDGMYQDYPTDTTTADGQQITLRYSVRFRIDPTQVTTIAEQIGPEEQVVEKVVKFHTRILARNIPKEYAALDLYAGNVQHVQDKFAEELRPLLADKGVILEAFGLRKIDFQDDYVQAIEQKQIEAENVTTEQNRAEQAKWKAQSAIEAAKGEAQATIENAKGDAEKVKLLAAAEAEAIEVKGKMLAQYPEIIQLEFVTSLRDPASKVTWGVIPQSSVLPFLDVTPDGAGQP